MQQRHVNRKQYFTEQAYTTKVHVIPYIEAHKPITEQSIVLEIGCGEGGNLVPFLDRGCTVYGIDLSDHKIGKARDYFKEIPGSERSHFICEDIYNISDQTLPKADLIIMRDVIEHIPNQDRFMGFLKKFLKDDGHIFFGFPPWYMPFGGHQQVCKNKWLSKLPYFHLLPTFIYTRILSLGGESEQRINNLIEVKETGISIERFRRILKKHSYRTVRETSWLFNPNYEAKFNLKPRKQLSIISSIYFFRNFFTTCLYSLVTLDEKAS